MAVSSHRFCCRWFVLAVFCASAGCGGAPQTADPPVELEFDSRNPEITFRWLIQQATPVRYGSEVAAAEQANNPLRKDAYNANLKLEQSWNRLMKAMIGQKVIWPVSVQLITTQVVEIDCLPKQMEKDNIEVKVRFAEYPEYRLDNCDGKLVIGQSILLEQAKKLNRGSRLSVQGVIDKIDQKVSAPYPGYIVIYVSQTKAIMP